SIFCVCLFIFFLCFVFFFFFFYCSSAHRYLHSFPTRRSSDLVAIFISPLLPNAAHGIFDQLNWKMELSGKDERFSLEDAEWGRLPDGHVVGKPVPLFPRIEC